MNKELPGMKYTLNGSYILCLLSHQHLRPGNHLYITSWMYEVNIGLASLESSGFLTRTSSEPSLG